MLERKENNVNGTNRKILRLGSNENQLIIKAKPKVTAYFFAVLSFAPAQVVLQQDVIVLESHNGSRSN